MKRLAALAGSFVLAGCGSTAAHRSAPAASLASPPPIEAVDAAPDPELQRMLDELLSPPPSNNSKSVSGMDFFWGSGSSTTTPTPAQLAQLQAQIEAQRAAEQPAPGSPPRVVARLPLSGGGEATFLVWHNDAGALCTMTQVREADGGGGGGGPTGPCVPETGAFAPHCAQICLGSGGEGPPGSTRWVLSGTVAGDADSLAVTTADGSTSTYPLTGPLVDGGARRVFLLDLGGSDWRTLTLYRGGAAVETTALPRASVVAELCEAQVGPPPAPGPIVPGSTTPPPGVQANAAALNACLKAHRGG